MRLTTAALAAILAGALATPALAESFLESLAKQAAQRAATQAAQRAVDTVVNGGPKSEGAAGQAAPEAPAPQPKKKKPAAQPQVWAEPSPTNYPTEGVDRPGEFEFAPDIEAQKKAFVEFGAVACTGCEGGRSFDSWVQHHAEGMLGSGKLEAKVGSMEVGERLTWTGIESDGVLEVIGDSPIGDFPCKQLRYTLTRKRGGDSAERLGLFCYGKASPYSANPSWVEAL